MALSGATAIFRRVSKPKHAHDRQNPPAPAMPAARPPCSFVFHTFGPRKSPLSPVDRQQGYRHRTRLHLILGANLFFGSLITRPVRSEKKLFLQHQPDKLYQCCLTLYPPRFLRQPPSPFKPYRSNKYWCTLEPARKKIK